MTSELCYYQAKLFQYLSGLNYHESSVHQSVYRNYICMYCDQKYLTHGELKNHTYTEHLKNNRCYVCGNTYNSINELRWHLSLHKKKKFKCGIGDCKKAYVRQANLQIHKLTHTNRLPYKCKLCKKQYAVRSGLRYHMQRHNGIVHYCSVCPATFKSSCALKVHMFTHTGKPYRCEFCSKTYTRRKTYVDHMLCGHNRLVSKKEVDDMFARNTGKVIHFNSVSSLEFSDME